MTATPCYTCEQLVKIMKYSKDQAFWLGLIQDHKIASHNNIQLGLFGEANAVIIHDSDAGIQGMVDGMAKADRGSSEEFKNMAAVKIRATAMSMELFQVDDVWERMPAILQRNMNGVKGQHMGSRLQLAARERIIVKDSNEGRTRSPLSHNGPRVIWRSLIYVHVDPIVEKISAEFHRRYVNEPVPKETHQ